jgi:hypothetical protein
VSALVGNRTAFERLPGGGYAYVLLDEGVRIELRHVRRDWRQLHAEVDVQCNWAGAARHRASIHSADVNLSKQSDRRALATYCQQRAKTRPEDFDWQGTIDAACIETIQADRKGSDVIILDDAPALAERDFDVLGLKIPADASSIVIAHGDSLKSMLLLLVLGQLAVLGHRVLYIDYEWTAARHAARKRRLFGADRLDNLRYLRCHAPLTIEADAIRRYADEHHIEFVALDSIGLACDGKLADDDTAIRFHRALATLPPALCAAHVPKSSLGPDGKGDAIGPFGSVFFSNLCRKSWLIKKQTGATDNLATVGCFPQKQNDGERDRPVGLEFAFDVETIAVRPVNLANVDGLAEKLPLSTRMIHLLKGGPLTLAAISEELDAKLDSVIKAANRGERSFTRITGQDGIMRIALVERHVAA